MPQSSDALLLSAVLALVSAGIILFSQTLSWYGDEGFHLLAAQLINAGRKPYADFVFAQTPLYAYGNAGWMRLLGETWRSVHLLSAILTSGCIALTAQFVFSRWRGSEWRFPLAITATALLGLNSLVIRFGTVGQAYGICLFLIFCAFRFAVQTADDPGIFNAAGAGLCSGAAASCSLLSAPVAPILLLWIVRHSRPGNRGRRAGWFLVCAALPFTLVIWLAIQAPRQTFFGIVEYHLFHRAPNFRTPLRDDLEVLSSWLESPQGLPLVLLAGLGVLSLARLRDVRRKRELWLCALLSGGLAIYLACAHPTYPQYFVLLLPFAVILAVAGVHAIGQGIGTPGHPILLALLVVSLSVLGLVKSAYDQREMFTFRWKYFENIAARVNEVTPEDRWIWADEAIYFAAKRRPPSGLEYSDSHKLQVSPELRAALHVIPRRKLEDLVGAGRFDTVAACFANEKFVQSMRLPELYTKSEKRNGCYLFWDKIADHTRGTVAAGASP